MNYKYKIPIYLTPTPRLPWLPFQDGRHRIFDKAAAKISQKPLFETASNFQDLFIVSICVKCHVDFPKFLEICPQSPF